ncbi:MAG: hypothetical protein A2Y76_06785 [Planctomycetes bacterium RBG_13_60_9]|nr:MAG: hypothetical protein A2Y76_06785 [Planctomycetes bacterium RBG_13_60_9]
MVIPQFVAGGAERVMSILTRHLSQRCEVHLIFHVCHKPFYDVPDTVSLHYVDTIRPRARLLVKVWRYLAGLMQLRKLLKTIRPDVIVSFHNYRYDHLVVLAKMFLRIPVVVSDRSNPVRYRGLKRLTRRAVYEAADAIVVQTDFARQYYERHFPHKKIARIANPVSVFPSCVSAREPLILTIGRLIADKGHAYLIRAFAKLNLDGWRLVIVGDGPLARELKELADELGVGEKTIFAGLVTDIGSYLRRASIFVLPSLREGFPNALAEAMASGIPCISFNCNAGPSELIRDGANGFLVEPRDVDGLTEKIRLLVSDKKLGAELGAQACKVAARFSEHRIMEQWERLLGSLC